MRLFSFSDATESFSRCLQEKEEKDILSGGRSRWGGMET